MTTELFIGGPLDGQRREPPRGEEATIDGVLYRRAFLGHGRAVAVWVYDGFTGTDVNRRLVEGYLMREGEIS